MFLLSCLSESLISWCGLQTSHSHANLLSQIGTSCKDTKVSITSAQTYPAAFSGEVVQFDTFGMASLFRYWRSLGVEYERSVEVCNNKQMGNIHV